MRSNRSAVEIERLISGHPDVQLVAQAPDAVYMVLGSQSAIWGKMYIKTIMNIRTPM